MKKIYFLLLLTSFLAIPFSSSFAAETENYLVQCQVIQPVDSPEMETAFSDSFFWMMRQRDLGLIENVYFPTSAGGVLTYIGKTSDGDTGIVELIESDPFVSSTENPLVSCEYQRIGVLLSK